MRKQIKEMTTTKRVAAAIYAEETKDREEVGLLGEVHDMRNEETEDRAKNNGKGRLKDTLNEG